jgi:hypothetical protein
MQQQYPQKQCDGIEEMMPDWYIAIIVQCVAQRSSFE